jgi:hypothetical protein
MVDTSSEMNLWRFEGIIGWKMNVKKENSTSIRRVIRTHNSGLPVKHVISNGTSRTVCWRILSQIDQFFFGIQSNNVDRRPVITTGLVTGKRKNIILTRTHQVQTLPPPGDDSPLLILFSDIVDYV